MRFEDIYQKVHARHASCLRDEWLSAPCPTGRPIVWSRRNGPWTASDILWVGAAPGNAGGKGAGHMGAHGTRIPFGGDVAGANLEVLFSSIGITRNDTFITASLNSLPKAGGGEPTLAELGARVGDYESSLHLLRDTIAAVQPKLIVCLGNVALRCTIASTKLEENGVTLPTLAKIQKAGFARGQVGRWAGLPPILWLTHPSAQNMSPYAGVHTVFHTRMVEARDALRAAVKSVLKWKLPSVRSRNPTDGIYALPEWKELVGPRHEMLDALWREKGI
ncbi:MAG TPA: uracil-DNA glycosylase family protein [Longimicrobiales bacterium]|nr:uracil-DNA glycosylase family protein [Longimicrobiales bacterium]